MGLLLHQNHLNLIWPLLDLNHLIITWPLHTWYNFMRSSDAYSGYKRPSLLITRGLCALLYEGVPEKPKTKTKKSNLFGDQVRQDWFLEGPPKNQEKTLNEEQQSFEGPGLFLFFSEKTKTNQPIHPDMDPQKFFFWGRGLFFLGCPARPGPSTYFVCFFWGPIPSDPCL